MNVNEKFVLKIKKKRGERERKVQKGSLVTEKVRKNEHLVGIPSGCFYFQDIDCVSGKPPASRETYWITDNLGIDMASTRGV